MKSPFGVALGEQWQKGPLVVEFIRGVISKLRSWLYALSHSKDTLIIQPVCHENVTGGFSTAQVVVSNIVYKKTPYLGEGYLAFLGPVSPQSALLFPRYSSDTLAHLAASLSAVFFRVAEDIATLNQTEFNNNRAQKEGGFFHGLGGNQYPANKVWEVGTYFVGFVFSGCVAIYAASLHVEKGVVLVRVVCWIFVWSIQLP